jgi:P22 coat protein - gene protein 5
MANSNTLTEVIPKLLAQGMLALRQMAIMPRYVNRGFETIAGEKGSSIDVPIPSAITAQAVSPSYVPPDDAGFVPTKVSIALDQWWEAPFFLTDKDMLEAMNGTIPMQASEAIKSLANKIDTLLIAKAEASFPSFAGVAGTTPFANDLSEFLSADQMLNDYLAPPDNRFMAISSRAKANAMGLRAFQDASYRGDTAGLIKNEIGEKLGAMWFMDQNLTRHTAGSWTNVGTTTGTNAAGATTVNLTGGTGSILAGDKITFSGADETTYVVSAPTGTAPTTAIVVYPPLVTAKSSTETVTVKASHRMNFLFHRDALALASRPFEGADPMGLGVYQSAVDPISGLALRLEVTRQHKRTRWSYDILCGVGSPRPQFGAVIAGE